MAYRNDDRGDIVMSDYQVTNYGICGECKWHRRYEHDKYWSCDNKDSDYYTDYTDYTDTCEHFEQRGIE